MVKLQNKVAKQVTPEEQAIKDTLRSNIKKYRHRRNWSQFQLAAKINISTNFLADIEAGNTWISAQTLAKLALAFEIDAFELLKPQKEEHEHCIQDEVNSSNAILSQFSNDLAIVMQESMEKTFDYIKKQYRII
ncbi:MAG: helix-turn-helix transcriptional regulator [Treponema sp.]|nr:helix-turn-helix transcriptional regulator [Treponema sp.]